MANRLHNFGALLAWAILFLVTAPGHGQDLAATGSANSAPQSDAMGDSLLRTYSVDELLNYKHFYESERAQLEKERAALREKGIRDLETFIRSHPESNVLDRVIFRLAELYYEQAEAEYFAAQERYGRELDLYDAGQMTEEPVEPKKDFSRTLSLYRELIENYPHSKLVDDAHYAIAFITEEMQKKDEAIALYEAFLEAFPDSPYVPDVLMRQAEYYFNPPQNQLEKAITIYKKILHYSDTPKYDEALYKLGWSYYKLSDYPQAISYFTMLADDIERARRLDPNSKVSNPALRDESIEYIGISFIDYTGVNGAYEYLNAIGGREYGIQILRKIGDAYMDVKEEYAKAIDAYNVLLKLYPFTPDAPMVLARIAEAYRLQENEQQAYLMRKKLFAEYREGSDWWNQVTDKNARARARELVEHALRANINLLLDVGNETNNPNLFAQAVDDTRDYLKAFPDDTNAVRLHWNMALTLDAKLHQPEDAYEEYIEISNLYWGSKFQKEAARNAIAIAQDFVQPDTVSSKEDVFPVNIGALRDEIEQGNPDVQKKLNLDRVALTPGEQKLTAAIDNFIKLFPFDKETPARLSQAGAIYYNKHDFINALKYFKTLLKHFPEHELADQAEFLVMESYFGNLDFRSVEIVARRILAKDRNAEYTAKANQRLAEAIFLQAQSLADASDHFKAAEEYSRVAEEVPDAEFADLALFNAGLQYDRAREYSRSVEIYSRLIDQYRGSKYYIPAMSNLALDYRELKDFRNAAIIFERLASEDPDSSKIENHLYNASVSYVDAEDWERAIRVNTRFVELFPNSADAEDMLYNVATYHLKLNEFDKANEIYGEYARKFPNSPRVVETAYRRGEYFLERGDIEAARVEFATAVEKNDSLLAENREGNSFFAAEALFHLTELKFREFQQIKFMLPPQEMQNNKDRKKALLIEIVDAYGKVAAFGTVRLYEATHKIGAAYEEFAKTWANQQIPPGTEEQRIVARKEINETATGLYERAVEAYKNSLTVLTRIADQYRMSYVESQRTDSTAAGHRLTVADTTLQVANRWIERSKEKISENIYNIAEINANSVAELLKAPLPPGMDELTTIEFRNQLLAKFVQPLVEKIVQAHLHNVSESQQLGIDNQWVDLSRSRIITTGRIIPDHYAKLSWQAFQGYANLIEPYTQQVVEDNVAALALSDKMANFIDFGRSHGQTAIAGYAKTIDRAAKETIRSQDLVQVEEDFLEFITDVSAYIDSLARVANARRKQFELDFKRTQEPAYEDGLFIFEDNYFNLSETRKTLLKFGYEYATQLQIDNEFGERILLELIKSAPEEYAGALGLSVEMTHIGSDTSWLARDTVSGEWMDISPPDLAWGHATVVDSGKAFAAYGAHRIWFIPAAGVPSRQMPADTVAVDTLSRVKESFATLADTLEAEPDSTAPVAAEGSAEPVFPGVIYLRKDINVQGLPISGQIQIHTDGAYKLYINGEFISQTTATASADPMHIHTVTDFLQPGRNVLALEVRDVNETGSGFEAVVFLRHLPGWEKRQAEIQAQKAREAENLLFDKGLIRR